MTLIRHMTLALLVLRAMAMATPAGASPVVTDVRIGVHLQGTRFVIDMSEAADHVVFTLADPYRLVIDMPELDWELPNLAGQKGGGLVAGYRYGLFRPGNSRLVLDFEGPVAVSKQFSLDPAHGRGHRLVFDLVATDRETFMKTAGWPKASRFASASPAKPVSATQGSKSKKTKKVIVIDPGHGGVDPGAIGSRGTMEKNVVLDFGKVLRDKLVATGKYNVVMTRTTDIFVPLKERVRIARDNQADLFISLHGNSIKEKSVRGTSIYTLSERASDKEAAALAHKENRSDIIAGVDLDGENTEVMNILIDLAQRETKNHSAEFAQTTIRHISGATQLLANPHRFAGFRVLKAPDVPSVLVELAYLTNRSDERLLRSASWREKMARAMVASVNAYFAERFAEGVY